MTKNAMLGFLNRNLQQFNRSYPQNDVKEVLNDIYFDNNHLLSDLIAVYVNHD